ncbi:MULTISPECIES: acyltransferase family protein [unclassified Rhodococcus (in: high G+C Gram-positive bacteria)]|uniref:acyltransferase family protein n=1 Tax=unclassified Rhodococcus (in: high G+C Gram-positive bacteria) TaxID=192944 RepID=UPI00163AB915|nr:MULTISPECIES: acyltransferase family protein [unclassified Rhodococcus (in: high G+C Gram-positive bacteria)]MBC2638328.1 acyltransferase [Rhodococcus sp. 3A]MBC2896931.1 acyltransferase [Rhodococcus sp. 4CII]
MNTVASPERRRLSAARRPNDVPQADTGFRPDIEGLRAVAVLAVVLFHVGVPGMAGGFAGVDIFFVVSGFLITGLLWRDVASTGRVRLTHFYGARARRLLPAGCVVLVATAIGAAVLLPPLQARQVLGDGIASALYVGNYRFALHGTDYLAADTPPSPFQHYWSLGVEEQFYLLWPALIIAVAWLVRRRTRHAESDAPPSATPYLLLLAVVAAASFAVSLDWTRNLPPWAFFSLPSRAWELAAGGLVALSIRHWRRLPPVVAAAAGWAGLALIVVACTRLGEATPYPGTAALLPVAGTVLVIGAGCAAPRLGVGRSLSLPPMRAVGRMSYSWYLWHWPVLLLAPVVLGRSLVVTDRLAILLVSAGLALLTLHLIENPVRFATPLRHSTARSLAVGGTVTALAVCAALVLLVLRPVPVGHGAEAAALTVAAPPVPAAAVDPQEAAVREVTAQVQAAVTESAGLQAVPSNLSPPLADAPADKPAVFVNGCVRSWREVGQDECASGDVTSPTTVALVGDSHAAMWAPAFEQAAEQHHWRLETMGKVTCPLLDLTLTSPYLGREYTECEQWRGEIVDRLQTERPRLVVLSMSRRYGADFGFTVYGQAWLDSLTRLVTELRATGAAVLVLGPIPDPKSTVPTCLSDHLDDATACSPPRQVAVDDVGVAAEATATTAGGGRYADLTSLFCTTDLCPVVVGNDLVFRDDNHLTLEHAQALTPVVAALADLALAPG